MNLKKWKVVSIVFSIIAGTLLHFTYEWSGQNRIVGAFSAVNESTWEHLKLAFFPMLFIGLIGYFLFGSEQKNYIKGNVVGIISAILCITIFFYTYQGIIGNNFAVINILIFIISVIIGENVAYLIMKNQKNGDENIYLAIIVVLAICFIVFTYFPPEINFFMDPMKKTFGIGD